MHRGSLICYLYINRLFIQISDLHLFGNDMRKTNIKNPKKLKQKSEFGNFASKTRNSNSTKDECLWKYNDLILC